MTTRSNMHRVCCLKRALILYVTIDSQLKKNMRLDAIANSTQWPL